MDNRIVELAAEMNAAPADVATFVKCLAIWTSKGYTVEQAIHRHMRQMERLVNKATQLPAREIIVSMYDDLRAAA